MSKVRQIPADIQKLFDEEYEIQQQLKDVRFRIGLIDVRRGFLVDGKLKRTERELNQKLVDVQKKIEDRMEVWIEED